MTRAEADEVVAVLEEALLAQMDEMERAEYMSISAVPRCNAKLPCEDESSALRTAGEDASVAMMRVVHAASGARTRARERLERLSALIQAVQRAAR